MNECRASTFGTSEQAPVWYLVHCKPRQDERAEENLLRQGYGCYRPQHSRERIVRGRRQTVVESLFPGYLFIQLTADASWAPLRSTRGVNRLVGFGSMPLPLDNSLIAHLQQRAATIVKPVLEVGDSVHITAHGFAELDAIFINTDGDSADKALRDVYVKEETEQLPGVLESLCEYTHVMVRMYEKQGKQAAGNISQLVESRGGLLPSPPLV